MAVVHLAPAVGPNADTPQAEQPQDLEDAVMTRVREVDDATWQHLARQVQPVHVALGAPVGDVPRHVSEGSPHKSADDLQDLTFEVVGLQRTNVCEPTLKRVSEIVEREAQERSEDFAVVEVEIERVADELLAAGRSPLV